MKKRRFIDWLSYCVLAAYVASVMLFSYAEGKTFITKYIGVTAVLLFFMRLPFRRGIPVTREWSFLVVWVFVTALSAVFANAQDIALYKLLTLLQVLSVSFIVFCLAVWARSVAPIWGTFVLVTCIVSIFTYLDPNTYSELGRLRGTFNNANLYGLVLVVAIAVCLSFGFRWRSWLMWIPLMLAAFFFLYMLGETGSRKAIVGALFVIILLTAANAKVYFKKHIMKGTAFALVGVAMLGVAVYVITESSQFKRTQKLINAIESEDVRMVGRSESGRLLFYKKGLEAVMKSPVIGHGLGNFGTFSAEFGQKVGAYSHSNYIEVMVSTGFLGLIIYYSIYVALGLNLYRLRRVKWNEKGRSAYVLTYTLFIVYVVYDFALVSYYEKLSWLILSALIASAYLLTREAKLNKRNVRIYHRARQLIGNGAETAERKIYTRSIQ